jgi:hypothetical protein
MPTFRSPRRGTRRSGTSRSGAQRSGAPWLDALRLGPRGVLAFAMGIAAIFDLTGATVYRTMRGVLPPAPLTGDDGSDPFRAAMGTIISAHHDALVDAGDESGTALSA